MLTFRSSHVKNMNINDQNFMATAALPAASPADPPVDLLATPLAALLAMITLSAALLVKHQG